MDGRAGAGEPAQVLQEAAGAGEEQGDANEEACQQVCCIDDRAPLQLVEEADQRG